MNKRSNTGPIIMAIYLLFLMLPIYWLVNMSLKTNAEIISGLTQIGRASCRERV